jgi:hypothetical protein
VIIQRGWKRVTVFRIKVLMIYLILLLKTVFLHLKCFKYLKVILGTTQPPPPQPVDAGNSFPGNKAARK